MRALRHGHLYSRETVLREMSGAGQFAHLVPAEIEAVVSKLYDYEDRLYHDGTPANDVRERAVPLILARAYEWRFSKECYDGEVINYVARRLGIVCCLCLAIDEAESRDRYELPHGFMDAVCPTYLTVEGRGKLPSHQPACVKCRRAVSNYFWRSYGFKGPRGDDAWDSALAWLLINPGFRERVKANAPNIVRLRFDPRRVQQRIAA